MPSPEAPLSAQLLGQGYTHVTSMRPGERTLSLPPTDDQEDPRILCLSETDFPRDQIRSPEALEYLLNRLGDHFYQGSEVEVIYIEGEYQAQPPPALVFAASDRPTPTPRPILMPGAVSFFMRPEVSL